VLLLARAPLVLFQAIQTSILPHLTRLWVTGEGADPFRRSVNITLMAVAGFAGGVSIVMLAAGPALMGIVFGGDYEYERGGLVLVSVAMGLYLSAATLNQALLAQGRARQACAVWVGSATGFVGFLLVSPIDDPVLSVEVALIGAAACLCALLYSLYRRA
jgi:O-antigen/teichoic acid export membrane protein